MRSYEMNYRLKGETGIARQAVVVCCKDITEAMDSVARTHFIQVTGIEWNACIELKHPTAYHLGSN